MYIPVVQCMKQVHKCDLCDVLTWSVDSSYSDAFGSMPYTCILITFLGLHTLHQLLCHLNKANLKKKQ